MRTFALLATMSLFISSAGIQAQNGARIRAAIDSRSTTALAGSEHPYAGSQTDLGQMSTQARISGVTMHFKPSATQKAELDALVQAQQTPGSPHYHQWLTPEQYASRFGLNDTDLAAVQQWLEQQGLVVERVSRSHTSITFTGTVGQIESTFQTSMHRYQMNGESHFANSTQISIPTALGDVVQSVRNLNDFRPKPHVRIRNAQTTTIKVQFTSSQSGSHYLTPLDVATIYDINAAYNAGYTGSGQAIAVVGQSSVVLSDIEKFQTAAGLTVKDPTAVLVPGSGSAAVSSGDESESDLDLEYSSSIAKGATIYFVYTGNNQNYSVWDSIAYAVDTNIAPIISISYGACEPDIGSSDFATLELVMEQGASQGQSIVASSGDAGSTACYADVSSGQTITTTEKALSVNYPASSAYVTAIGGTEFSSDDVASSNTTYWSSSSGSDVVSSAKSYIPEQVWNDDSATYGSEYGAEYALSAGGGGVSIYTVRPAWQTGVTGIVSGSYRLLPDVSLDSSPNNAGYLYCSSDSSATGITGSCSDGFRDSSNQYLTVAGGTSFAAPIFAGMLAIVNQKENTTGQGLVNSKLYSMASDSSIYASAFHDITSGSNACTAGSSYCSTAGASSYSATTGYDEATGLGSVDFYNLLTSWPSGSTSPSLLATTTVVSPANSTPSSGTSDVITITVSPQSSSATATPTGTVTVSVDGTAVGSSLTLSNGSTSYTFSSTTSGSHVIAATYSGDATYAASTGSATVTVSSSGTTTTTGSFSLAATNVTATQGSSGTSVVTVTSANSYAGTVSFTVSTSSSALSSYGCYDINNVSVAANGTATATLTVYTSESACSTSSSSKQSTHLNFVHAGGTGKFNASADLLRGYPLGIFTLGGALWCSVRRRRSILRELLGCLVLLSMLGLFSGCGSTTSTSNYVAKGTYTLQLNATDTSNTTITAVTTLTLTVN